MYYLFIYYPHYYSLYIYIQGLNPIFIKVPGVPTLINHNAHIASCIKRAVKCKSIHLYQSHITKPYYTQVYLYTLIIPTLTYIIMMLLCISHYIFIFYDYYIPITPVYSHTYTANKSK